MPEEEMLVLKKILFFKKAFIKGFFLLLFYNLNIISKSKLLLYEMVYGKNNLPDYLRRGTAHSAV